VRAPGFEYVGVGRGAEAAADTSPAAEVEESLATVGA
jgi:hypothetical protein